MRVQLFIAIKLSQLDSIHTRRVEYFVIIRVFYESSKYSQHAEKDAIQKIRNKNILKICKIYIIKVTNNEIEQAMPCSMCCDLLKKYKVEKIVAI
jgi:cytidine deaminase